MGTESSSRRCASGGRSHRAAFAGTALALQQFATVGTFAQSNLPSAPPQACSGTVYLTLDTGNMQQADAIVQILRKHRVPATFFLANEPTPRGDAALDPAWADFWRALVADGHAFGSHTWRHGRFLGDLGDGAVRYRPQFGIDRGRTLALTPAAVCGELKQVGSAFRQLTGHDLDAVWRAPAGRTTPNALAAAAQCGFAHVHWANAGFLGDELDSDRFPNGRLLDAAVRSIRDGDVLMAHLGIASRKDPFAPMFDPLIAGLKARGICFKTLREHPDYRAVAPRAELAAQRPARATAAQN